MDDHTSRRNILGAGLAGLAASTAAVTLGALPASASPGNGNGNGNGQGNGNGNGNGGNPHNNDATASSVLSWVSIHEYKDQVTNQSDPEEDWDWTAAIQSAIDENAGRVIYFPNTSPRYLVSDYIAMRSNTSLIGDGDSLIYFTIPIEDTDDILVRGGFFRLREQAVMDDPTGTFSYDITVRALSFESLEQQRNGVFKLVNARRVTIADCRFVNCGAAFVCHELEMNNSYVRANAGESGDPAVEAGFSPDSTDDLNEDIVFVNNYIDGVEYFVMALRLNFVKRAVITGNICRFGQISWWGGGARKGEGGEKHFLRRCLQFTIANNYLHQNNGAIYGNNGSEITVTGNVCEYSIDTAIDMEGCQNFTVDGNTVKYAGNFCYSVFYGCRNGVFSNNVAIQGPAAADMGPVGQQRGLEVFRQIASFDDATPEQYAIRGNTFRWDGDTGFGVVRLDNYGDVTISDNYFENVIIDGVVGHSKANQSLINNEFRFTNASAANDVYIALGRQSVGGRSCLVRDNRIQIENADAGAIPIVVVQHRSDSAAMSLIDRNVIDAQTDIAIAYGDLRTGTRNDGQTFTFRENVLASGSIANLSRGGKTEVLVESNRDWDLAEATWTEEPDTDRYPTLKTGLSVMD
ncbi:right-handed parallel beta-helix repeat-containing protein [Ruania halotolerans]|uniref:right-handed parallel beta-helix repeat-containing protein n=1 Tax=Ruania halotolerans TaxID=2897773 RepID=UPI001E64949E|nr:right-handed parallel beta-helix repeat-containing protein [Ruania halotolerans]UFU06077.1 right-handed parallel beta-helix repeat-containing protein [Ruania halotolerans]